MSAWSPLVYVELSGMVKLAPWIARVLSPNGRERKQRRYNVTPSACNDDEVMIRYGLLSVR